MPLEPEVLLLLFVGFFVIALVYSSVGFGGGSSYLALLSLVALSFFTIRSNALLCNLAVVSGSTLLFIRKQHFDLKAFWPFVVTSIPAAFIGASFRLTEQVFFILLGGTLILASVALVWRSQQKNQANDEIIERSNIWPYFLGAAIGLLSGLVGIGGGIFLAPVLHFLRWGRPIKIAALSAFFILANSLSGLIGLFIQGTFESSMMLSLPLLIAVIIGGQLGMRLSLRLASPNALRIITAVLVLIVGLRVFLFKGLAV